MVNHSKLIGTAPVFTVPDVVKTAEYYCAVLGFRLINYFMDPPVYAMVERDGFQVHFGKAVNTDFKKVREAAQISVDMIAWAPEIESYFNELKSNHATIVQEIVQRNYGREFIVEDCNGYRIAIVD